MYPITCPDGSEHEFEKVSYDPRHVGGVDNYKCTKCSTTSEQYFEAKRRLKKIEESIDTLTGYLNSGDTGVVADIMYNTLCNTHRTLQQRFLKSLYMFFKKMKDMPTDGRNEDSVTWCKKVSEIEGNFPFI